MKFLLFLLEIWTRFVTELKVTVAEWGVKTTKEKATSILVGFIFGYAAGLWLGNDDSLYIWNMFLLMLLVPTLSCAFCVGIYNLVSTHKKEENGDFSSGASMLDKMIIAYAVGTLYLLYINVLKPLIFG